MATSAPLVPPPGRDGAAVGAVVLLPLWNPVQPAAPAAASTTIVTRCFLMSFFKTSCRTALNYETGTRRTTLFVANSETVEFLRKTELAGKRVQKAGQVVADAVEIG